MVSLFCVEPLCCENFDETIKVFLRVFPDEYPEELEFHCLLPITPRKQWKNLPNYEENAKWVEKLSSIEIFSLRLKGHGIAGITSLYSYLTYPKEAWIAWFGIDPDFRKMGLGKELLHWTIDRARNSGYKVLRLWTDNSSEKTAARMLYQKSGFKSKTLSLELYGHKPIIYSLGLNGNKPPPFTCGIENIIIASSSGSLAKYIARQEAKKRGKGNHSPEPR